MTSPTDLPHFYDLGCDLVRQVASHIENRLPPLMERPLEPKPWLDAARKAQGDARLSRLPVELLKALNDLRSKKSKVRTWVKYCGGGQMNAAATGVRISIAIGLVYASRIDSSHHSVSFSTQTFRCPFECFSRASHYRSFISDRYERFSFSLEQARDRIACSNYELANQFRFKFVQAYGNIIVVVVVGTISCGNGQARADRRKRTDGNEHTEAERGSVQADAPCSGTAACFRMLASICPLPLSASSADCWCGC